MRAHFLGTSLALALALPAANAADLTIYTYEGFTDSWSTGPVVEKTFEAQCGCDVEFVGVTDGVALLNRLKLEGHNTSADIVLGLDTNLMSDAAETGLFAPHGLSLENIDVPGGWSDSIFIPYDYGHFAVIYDTEKVANPPSSLKELFEGGKEPAIVIQDPRTSTPGLGLVLWAKKVFGEEAPQAWAKFSERVLTVTPGWTEAYALFTSGETPMVLSYLTSPAYHMVAENTDRYKAASFSEGHYMQIEIAGQTVKGKDNPLAAQFLAFMTGPGFQDAIPETNWMWPAGKMDKPINPAFEKLVRPETNLIYSPKDVSDNRKAWVDEWLRAMSR